jgi:hypothetical protein
MQRFRVVLLVFISGAVFSFALHPLRRAGAKLHGGSSEKR